MQEQSEPSKESPDPSSMEGRTSGSMEPVKKRSSKKVVAFGLPAPTVGTPAETAAAAAAGKRSSHKAAIPKRYRPHFDIGSGQAAMTYQSVRRLGGPEPPKSRWQKIMHYCCCSSRSNHSTRVRPDTFRVTSVSTVTTRKRFKCLCARPMKLDSIIADWFRWNLRATFFQVLLAAFYAYVALSALFAVLIFWIAVRQPQCFVANSDEYRADRYFMDSFQLSWETLSTVGYGVIAPRVVHGSDGPKQEKCLGINAFMALEAFTGVLYAGIMGAVIFSKVVRMLSTAQVRFSQPICVRYGTGVMTPLDKDNCSSRDLAPGNDTEHGHRSEIPCPVLEFRLINLFSSVKGGEIVDAKVSVVATSLASHKGFGEYHCERFSKDIRSITRNTFSPMTKLGRVSSDASRKIGAVSNQAVKTTGAALFGAGKMVTKATGDMLQKLLFNLTQPIPEPFPYETSDEQGEMEPYNEKQVEEILAREYTDRYVSELAAAEAAAVATSRIVVNEGDSILSPVRYFQKLEMETDCHPFLKRIWNIRHVLNASSPLLSDAARLMIEENDGFWPPELNNHAALREHLHFDEIIVNFSGTANVSGSTVVAQKVYDFGLVNIGYEFCNVLHVHDSRLIVDPTLLNDIKEQQGGGAEPFTHSILCTGAAVNAAMNAVEMGVDATMQAGETVVDTALQAGDKVVDATMQAGETIVDAALQAGEKGVLGVDATVQVVEKITDATIQAGGGFLSG